MVRHGNSDRRSLRRSDHRDHRDRRHRYSGSDPMVRPSIRAVAAAAVESPRLKEAGPRRSTPERPLTDHGVQTVVRATRGICGHCDQNPTLVAKMVRGSGAAERLRQHATRRRRSLLHLDIGPSARLRHPVARRAPKHGNRAARGLLGGFYSGHCWRTCMVVANNVQTRIRSTLAHDGRRGLALTDADTARDAHRDESCNQSKQYFLHWNSPFFHAHARHTFVLRCTVSRPLNPIVHRLRRQWGTSKGTVSLRTQLRGVRSKTSGEQELLSRPGGNGTGPTILIGYYRVIPGHTQRPTLVGLWHFCNTVHLVIFRRPLFGQTIGSRPTSSARPRTGGRWGPHRASRRRRSGHVSES